MIIDGAHNPEGAEAAGRVLDEEFTVDGRRTLLIGMLTGRDPAAMLHGRAGADVRPGDLLHPALAPGAALRRAGPSRPGARRPGRGGAHDRGGPRVPRAAAPTASDLVFVTGSLYFVGAVRPLATAPSGSGPARPLPSRGRQMPPARGRGSGAGRLSFPPRGPHARHLQARRRRTRPGGRDHRPLRAEGPAHRRHGAAVARRRESSAVTTRSTWARASTTTSSPSCPAARS